MVGFDGFKKSYRLTNAVPYQHVWKDVEFRSGARERASGNVR